MGDIKSTDEIEQVRWEAEAVIDHEIDDPLTHDLLARV